MARFYRVGADLLSEEEYRMMGEALQMAEPLPPGLDWDYFKDDRNELGDTENPAVDAVFDWGQPLIGGGRIPSRRDLARQVLRACLPQPCIPPERWPPRWPGAIPGGPGPRPCPPRICPTPMHPNGPWPTSATGTFHVGADEADWEICERAPVMSGWR